MLTVHTHGLARLTDKTPSAPPQRSGPDRRHIATCRAAPGVSHVRCADRAPNHLEEVMW
jgi:hypothetical protein